MPSQRQFDASNPFLLKAANTRQQLISMARFVFIRAVSSAQQLGFSASGVRREFPALPISHGQESISAGDEDLAEA
jgi:hypothetical protein